MKSIMDFDRGRIGTTSAHGGNAYQSVPQDPIQGDGCAQRADRGPSVLDAIGKQLSENNQRLREFVERLGQMRTRAVGPQPEPMRQAVEKSPMTQGSLTEISTMLAVQDDLIEHFRDNIAQLEQII